MISFMTNNSIIETICGKQSGNIDLSAIENNPDFVFENDPLYETVVLYNNDGGIINVNSWIECANYVNGGWSNSSYPINNFDKYYMYLLLGLAVLTMFIKFVRKID